MSDDLLKRLLNEDGKDLSEVELHALCKEAADRIKQLEAALREIAALGFWDGDRAMDIARAALEGRADAPQKHI